MISSALLVSQVQRPIIFELSSPATSGFKFSPKFNVSLFCISTVMSALDREKSPFHQSLPVRQIEYHCLILPYVILKTMQ